MSEREVTIRTAVVTYFPMFIAVLSLVTSIYNGYLNGKFVDIIQRNFGRTEYLRTCKEIIDAYFQVKFRAGLVSESSERDRASGITSASAAQIDAASAVSKFAALGTYLANLTGRAHAAAIYPAFMGARQSRARSGQDITRRTQQTVRAGRPAFLRHEQ